MGLFLICWTMLAAAPASMAASSDVFDSFRVDARVDSDGYVNVTETIVLRFGSSSGRHGLERTLITREPDGEDHDVLFVVDQVAVTSPSGVSTALDVSEGGGGRNTYTRVRVGSANRTIGAATATYVLSYRVRGLMRTFSGYDELYWDVTGSQMPLIVKADVQVRVPGGAKEVFCSAASPGKKADCGSSTISDGVAKFKASKLPRGRVMTIGVKIGSGLVAENAPIRVESAEKEDERRQEWLMAGSLAVAVVVPFLGWWYVRRRTSDYRWEDLPPGSFPAPGQPVKEVRSSRRVELPVCFAPPRLAVTEAGFLIDGKTQVRDTTAALVGLAVSGAIQLCSGETKQVRLVDASRAPDEVSATLLRGLFPSTSSLFPASVNLERVVDLGERGELSSAHDRVTEKVRQSATAGHWYARMPAYVAPPAVIWVVPVALSLIAVLNEVSLLILFPMLLSTGLTALVAGRRLARGQRSATGRALTDQVEGFRKYLATAEAEQLQFEEGVDIFSRYLPWAVMFGLTARWTRVCERLVELGRLSGVAPAWYYGSEWNMHDLTRQMNEFDRSVGDSVTAPSSSSFDESGFGSSSSSFDSGGGFSGGGGGGGGGGSW